MADKKIAVDCIEHADQVLVDEAGRIKRLPVPSDDPNDPLNFALWEKTGIVVCCCWFCESFFLQLRTSSLFPQLSCHSPSLEVWVQSWMYSFKCMAQKVTAPTRLSGSPLSLHCLWELVRYLSQFCYHQQLTDVRELHNPAASPCLWASTSDAHCQHRSAGLVDWLCLVAELGPAFRVACLIRFRDRSDRIGVAVVLLFSFVADLTYNSFFP